VTETPEAELYFSTAGNVAIPGVPTAAPPAGGYDNADVYAWHSGSTYSRVFDATANGVPANADIDALVVEDDDTFYMSFRGNPTIDVPPAGPTNNITAQDEDIVLFDDGDWSFFFDGSDVNLTTNAEDVDAFEILDGTHVLVSTTGDPNVPGITDEGDEDLLLCTGSFTPGTSDATTTCTWSYYMDGSDIRLRAGGEGVPAPPSTPRCCRKPGSPPATPGAPASPQRRTTGRL